MDGYIATQVKGLRGEIQKGKIQEKKKYKNADDADDADFNTLLRRKTQKKKKYMNADDADYADFRGFNTLLREEKGLRGEIQKGEIHEKKKYKNAD